MIMHTKEEGFTLEGNMFEVFDDMANTIYGYKQFVMEKYDEETADRAVELLNNIVSNPDDEKAVGEVTKLFANGEFEESEETDEIQID